MGHNPFSGVFFCLTHIRSTKKLAAKIKEIRLNTNWVLKKNNWIWGYVILIGIGCIIGEALSMNFQFIDITTASFVLFWMLILTYVFPIILFSAFGVLPLKTISLSSEEYKKQKFLVIIAAYNESRVISNSVKSMVNQAQKFSQSRIIVAFNGTDNTDEIARSLGAEVITTPTPGCGKSQAIAYVLEQVAPTPDRYILILDADNITDLNFLDQMALATLDGSVALQGNHHVLLASKNWVSRGLEAGYAASSRLFNPGRSRLLNSALLCGTGFAVREDIFRHLWTKIRTQTEDIELNGLLSLEYGCGAKWVQSASFFDEKPDAIAVAIRQRVRWMVGHMKCMWHYSWDLLIYAIKKRDIRAFELSIYYTTPVMVLLSSLWLMFILPTSFILPLGIFPSSTNHAWLISSILAAYIIGLPMCGYFLLNRHKNQSFHAIKSIYFSALSSVFALLAWPMSILLATLMLARTDWMFHTPHRTSMVEK